MNSHWPLTAPQWLNTSTLRDQHPSQLHHKQYTSQHILSQSYGHILTTSWQLIYNNNKKITFSFTIIFGSLVSCLREEGIFTGEKHWDHSFHDGSMETTGKTCITNMPHPSYYSLHPTLKRQTPKIITAKDQHIYA